MLEYCIVLPTFFSVIFGFSFLTSSQAKANDTLCSLNSSRDHSILKYFALQLWRMLTSPSTQHWMNFQTQYQVASTSQEILSSKKIQSKAVIKPALPCLTFTPP